MNLQSTDLHEIYKPTLNPILSKQELIGFRLSQDSVKVCENSEELRAGKPLLVIAECLKDISFSQTSKRKEDLQILRKKEKYIMSLSVYMQLRENEMTGKILRPAGKDFKSVYRPYTGQDLTNKKLFVCRTGGFGDLMFIQPNLIYLKNKYPTCEILFSCASQYHPMVRQWDCIDNLILLPVNLKTFCLYDYHAIFEGLIERNKEAERENAYRLFSRWLGLNLPDELLVPQQKPNEEKIEQVKEILHNNNFELDKFIVIQPRTSSPIRTPRPQFWIDIINKLCEKGFKIALADMQTKADQIQKVYIEEIKKEFKQNILNFSYYSETMDYTIALVHLSKMCLAVDSSLIHIAASLRKKIFGVYGPFPGNIRMDTYPNSDYINGTCPISPCFTHGQKPCLQADKNKFSICFDSINKDDLVERVIKLYEQE